MSFTTYIPQASLQPYVQSIAISEAAAGQDYKVLPGTGIVLGFQYRGRLTSLHSGDKTPLATAGVTGIQDSFRMFRTEGFTGTVLVYFKDGAAGHFFQHPINEIYGHSLSLDNFIVRSDLDVVEEQLAEAKNAGERINIVERFLLKQLKTGSPDAMVFAAIGLIYQRKGNVRISELITKLHISQSPFEKRFRSTVGVSAKKFASIVRMKHIIDMHKTGTALTGIGYEAGFYDQAHFIKEFKQFTGETPGGYLE